jgi:LPS O-antigen subunit length determinant protein (WzzB/FepE family)
MAQLVEQLQRDAELNSQSAPKAPSVTSPQIEIDLFRVWLHVKRYFWIALLIAAAAAAAGYLTSMLVSTRLFLATALLRPMNQASLLNSMQGNILGGGLGELLPGLNLGEDRAQELVAILKSHTFTQQLIEQYHLRDELAPQPIRNALRPSDWEVYQRMEKRFDCGYDRMTGNITLQFLASSRQRALAVLAGYIENLRKKLRTEEMEEAHEAIVSLRQEAVATADTILQTQLYQLIALQLQRQKLAEVQADFDFKVIDPPMVPDKPARPRPAIAAAVTGGLALMSVMIVTGYRRPADAQPRSPRRQVASQRTTLAS